MVPLHMFSVLGCTGMHGAPVGGDGNTHLCSRTGKGIHSLITYILYFELFCSRMIPSNGIIHN